MAFPRNVNAATPAGSDSPASGDDELRTLKQDLLDILGWPSATNISQSHPTTVGFEVDGGSTEATTTSTSNVDLKSVSTSITVDEGAIVLVSYRKTSGAAAFVRIGLKVNTTIVFDGITASTSTNANENGLLVFFIGPRSTSYLLPVSGFFNLGGTSGTWGSTWPGSEVAGPTDLPNATITSIVIRGSVSNAAITLGVNNVMAFKLPKGS